MGDDEEISPFPHDEGYQDREYNLEKKAGVSLIDCKKLEDIKKYKKIKIT